MGQLPEAGGFSILTRLSVIIVPLNRILTPNPGAFLES